MNSGPLMPQVPAVAAVRAIEHLLSRPHETIHSVAVALATGNVLDEDLRLLPRPPRAWSFPAGAAAADGRTAAGPNGAEPGHAVADRTCFLIRASIAAIPRSR